MLIGQDHAGKTSVKRSLKGDKFNKDEASTAGVQMDPPLLRVGIQAWKPVSQSDEPTTVFDHKSAQLVARQLSGGSDGLAESPANSTAPVLLQECPAGKDCRTNGVDSSGYYFDLEDIRSQSIVLSSGVGSSQDSQDSQCMEGTVYVTFGSGISRTKLYQLKPLPHKQVLLDKFSLENVSLLVWKGKFGNFFLD